MGRYCVICSSQLRDEVDKFLLGGASPKWLAEYCQERGLKVTHSSIRNHGKNHIEGYEKPITHTIKKPSEAYAKPLDPLIVNFDDYCQEIGLDPEKLKDIPNNFDDIIGASQLGVTLIFFRLLCVTSAKLHQHQRNEGVLPEAHLKALRSTYEVYKSILSVNNLVDPNAAIYTLESMGYGITGKSEQQEN